MVCKIDDEEQATCVVRDFSGTSQDLKIEMIVSANMTGKYFVREVASRFNFESDSFKLVSPSICKKNGFQAVITEKSEETLKDIGINFENGSRNLFIVEGLDGNSKPIMKNDDLELGASASPEEPSSSNSCSPPLSEMSAKQSITRRFRLALQDRSPQSKSSDSPYFTGYRGLVNQAMTCYLNSLLQTLFMTPEFRNALYNWKYTPAPGTDESKSSPISFELQKLFLNLQTSPRESVETTELTRSFGWHNNEAWQQHDIQELCRLMFDELENEFKGTEQADLINELYQGKMIDYVKCLECGTEKSREDTFLDIPLPVRPFGRATAYGSVEEALRAFVQPEVLEGNNQYFCEKCNKKCDAHKGLKFLKFPYLLTLHLMRFDFDYNTMHRIKLSDKVVFPETLNLNSFVPVSNVSGSSIYKDEGSEGFPEEITGSSSKCDDSSTTDSGSAIDDENCMASSNDNVDYEQDVDEGIDVGNQLENEKNRNHNMESGPYVYELFSIMVHSGSASGGHYYAYIKDLCTGDWYCFNDQDVRRINSEQIENSFGGYAPTRGYYSGVYSSSMNAYMLMYRQIDKDRNVMPWKEHQFPPHIKALLKEMNEQAEYNKRLKEKERKMCKIKIFVHHPAVNSRRDSKIDCETREPLKEVIQKAHKKLQLEGTVPLELCRLVLYSSQDDSIEGSLEGRENDEIGSIILCDIKKCEMMLEIRSEDSTFQMYKPRSVPVQLLRVRLENNQLDKIVTRRTSLCNTVAEFRNELYSYFDVDWSEKLFVMLETKGKTERFLDDEKQQLETCGVTNNSRIFVCFKVTDSINKTRVDMRTQVKRYLNMLRLKILLPEVKSDTFQRWSEYASITNQKCSEETRPNEKDSASQVNESAMEITCNGCGGSNNGATMSALPSLLNTDETYSNEITSQTPNVAVLNINVGGHHSDQSASEDSSLTDSDRTIIGETQDDYQVSSSGSSPRGGEIRDRSTNDLVSEEENYYDTWNRTSGDYENVNEAYNENPGDYHFKEISNGVILEKKTDLKVEVDKRIPMPTFKKHLESYIQGSSLFFNIWSNDKMLNTLECVENNATLRVKLSRPPPKANMLKVKLFLLDYEANKIATDLDDFYIDESSTVGYTKKDLIQFLQDCHDIRINVDRCRLRIAPNGPGRICLNEEVWKDLHLMNDWELYVQQLDGAESITDPENEISVAIRRHSAKTGYSRLIQEIVLNDLSIDGLKARVAEVSGISEENLAFAVLTWRTVLNKNSFRMTYVPDTSLEWNTIANSKRIDDWLNNFKANDYLICYRDSREEPADRNCASEKPLKINSNKKRQS